MNIFVSSSDRDNQIFDSMYALSYMSHIKQKYPEHKICFGVPVQLYYFFSKFKIIDKTMINIFQCNNPSFIDYPHQIIGKFKNGEVFNKSFYKDILNNEININPFITNDDYFIEKRIEKILDMVKYGYSKKIMVVNCSKISEYPRFILSFRPVVEPHMKDGACVISVWDLFNLVNKFDTYVGDAKTGQFFSTMSKSKKIFLGSGDDINGEELYYKITRKNLGIEKYDVTYMDNSDINIDKVMGTLNV